jgi:penicillin amidase
MMNPVKLAFRAILGRRLPVTSGTLQVSGLERTVTIRRDRFGVPYIEAQTDADAWYSLGFCQGQDRAYQIEMLVRVCRGTVSELIGPDALQLDRLSRRIGFHHYAEQQVDLLDPDIRACLAAFVRGLNAGNTVGCRKTAHEFALLRAKPTALGIADVLAGLRYVAYSLSTWSEKLSRLIVLREDGPEAVSALSGSYASWLRVSDPVGALAGPALNRLAGDLSQLAEVLGWRGGSNGWALSASRTATGRPVLANDPHLGAMIPPPWYLAHVCTPEWAVAGAAYLGSPGFAAGHNDVAAWGVTAGLADNIDLYLEQIGEDGCSAREGDGFVPCGVRRETIYVKGKPPVVEEILVTPRGPVISPALEGDLGAVSMHATWMDPRPVRGVLALHRVQSLADFRRALSQSAGLSLGMVYADTSDTIGYQLTGDVPQRRGPWGTVPLPGWDEAMIGHRADIPFEQMPHTCNPATGFVAAANNKPSPDGEGPYLGMFWGDGYRYARIAELLEQRDDWDLDSTQRMQMDQGSIPWREMREAVLANPAATPEARLALDLLGRWDGILSSNSAAASVYELFASEMEQRIARAKAPNSYDWALRRGFNPLRSGSSVSGYRMNLIVRLLNEQPDGWFEHTWASEMAEALSTAVRRLQGQFGASPDGWAWGHVGPLSLVHTFGSRRPLDRVYNVGPFPYGGDGHTIAAAFRNPRDPTRSPGAIPNLRMALDVGNWEENRFVLAGGQSGNPLSPHYDDLLALWRRGEGITIPWSQEKIAQIARSMLRLEPSPLD